LRLAVPSRRFAARSLVPAALIATVLVAGCEPTSMPLDQARKATIASAGGAKLTGATLERWLGTVKGKPDAAGTEALVSAWIDIALLANATGDGKRLDDSATVDAVIAPDAMRSVIAKFAAARAAAVPDPTDAKIDSVAKAGSVRVFQQIILLVPRGSDSVGAAKVTARAKALHLQVSQAPATFTAVVHSTSEDTAGRANDGYLPAVEYKDLAPELAPRIWTLKPGAVSGVAATAVGRHIFRRATPEESRAAIKIWLRNRRARQADSAYRDSVTEARTIAVSAGAVERVRGSAREPVPVPAGGALATWKGGELSPEAERAWTTMLAPAARMSLAAASDSVVRAYIRELSWREILGSIVAPGHTITPDARKVLGAQYRVALDSVIAPLTRYGAGQGPEQVATMLADSAVAGRLRLRPMPGALSAVLRSRYPVTVDTAALGALFQATMAAWRPSVAPDSTKRGGKP
jgi:hypothetical protein